MTTEGSDRASGDTPVRLERWMWPAWQIGRFRPGLRSSTAADAARLRELPPQLGAFLLPALAIGLPILLALGQATTQRGFSAGLDIPISNVLIYDVFTESIVFTLAAALLGLASPAAGVLVVLAYGITNLAVTVLANELAPLAPSVFGRLVSYLVLWLLVVEIPLMGRFMVEWWSNREGAELRKRRLAVVVGSLIVLGLVFVWSQVAPTLVNAVFITANVVWPGNLPYAPAQMIINYGDVLVLAIGIGSLVLLGIRYLGPRVLVSFRYPEPGVGIQSPVIRYLVGMAISIALLTSFYEDLIDAIVIIAGLVVARPVARVVLRATRLARPLTRVAVPMRLLIAFAVTLALSWIPLAIFDAARLDISLWFPLTLSIALGFVVMEVFLGAEEALRTPASASTPVVVGIIVGLLILGILPPTVAADDGRGAQDFEDFIKALFAAAAAAALAPFLAARDLWGAATKPPPPPPPKPRRIRGPDGVPRDLPEYSGPQGQDQQPSAPKLQRYPGDAPPDDGPWWMPDGAGDFFGGGASAPPAGKAPPPMFGSRG